MSTPISVVTGGAGFIGSHLVEKLLEIGHEVRVVDNLSSGQMRNVELFKSHERYRFLHADINEKEKLTALFAEAKWVFHMAALADIVPSIQNPLAYHKANVDGTVSVLEAAREAGVERFVYAASSSCYGIPDVFPTPETSPIRPQYPYALTKYVGEEYAFHWNQVYSLPVISVRLLNVYGPRSRTSGAYGAVFGVFLAQKLARQPLTIVGEGTQTRDFTYVTDAVSALIACADSGIVGDAFNIGSGDTYSVNSLAAMIGGEVVYIPKRPGEPECTYADITKIKTRIGWEPQVRFEEGVAKVMACIEDWREAPVWTSKTIAEATKDWFRYLGKERPSSNS